MASSRFPWSGLFAATTPLLIIGLSIGIFMLLGKREAPVTRTADTLAAALVATTPVEGATGDLTIDVDGVVSPYREIQLAAEVSGRIHRKNPACRAGSFVTAGTELLEIDPRDYQLEVDRLTAEVEQAKVNLAENEVQLRNIEESVQLANEEVALRQMELRRATQLSDRGVSTAAEQEAAQRNELTARTSLLTLQNQRRIDESRRQGLVHALTLARTRLSGAELDLERTKIVAPVDAMIVDEPAEVGTFVSNGSPLVKLDDTSAVEVRCSLKMDELEWLWSRTPEITAASRENNVSALYELPRADALVVYRLGDREIAWSGKLARFDGWGIDERTRTIPCRIVVEQPHRPHLSGTPSGPMQAGYRPQAGGVPALMRGMYVSVKLFVESDASLVTLPERAVRAGNVVWVVRDDKLVMQPVVVARVTDKRVWLHAERSGLEVGEEVIVSPLSAPTSGMPVRRRDVGDEPPTADDKQPGESTAAVPVAERVSR